MKKCTCYRAGCSIKGVVVPTGTTVSYFKLPMGRFVLLVGGKPVGPVGAKEFFQFFKTKNGDD